MSSYLALAALLAAGIAASLWHELRHHAALRAAWAQLRHRPAPAAAPHRHWHQNRLGPRARRAAWVLGTAADAGLGWAWLDGRRAVVLITLAASLAALVAMNWLGPRPAAVTDLAPPGESHVP